MMRRSFLHLWALLALLSVFACDRVTPVAPVGSTITISVNPSRIDAQGEAAVVTIIVRKEDGTPVNPGTQVNVSTTLGTLEPEVTFTDETGVATSELTGDGRIGMATVSATTGAAALVSVEVQIGSVAASITLDANPKVVPRDPEGDGAVVSLTALVRDDTGAPLAGAIVNFAADLGSLASGGGPVETNDNGEAVDTLTVTRVDLSNLADVFFSVLAQTATEGGSLIEDIVDIDIGGVPAALTLQATPSTVAEEGGDVTLLALVVDGVGLALEGVRVTFLTNLGTLEKGFEDTDSEGRAEVNLAVSEADITSLGSLNVFEVRAQAAGLGGSVVEDSFQIRKTTCRPQVRINCTKGSGTDYQFSWDGIVKDELSFVWTFQRSDNSTVEDTISESGVLGSAVQYTFQVSGAPYAVILEVTDTTPGCDVTGTGSLPITAGSACP